MCKELDGLCLKLHYCTPGLVRTIAESTPYKGIIIIIIIIITFSPFFCVYKSVPFQALAALWYGSVTTVTGFQPFELVYFNVHSSGSSFPLYLKCHFICSYRERVNDIVN